MNELYLAVNPDGTELASNYYMYKAWDEMCNNSTEEYRNNHPLEKYCQNQWMDMKDATDYGYYGTDYSFEGIELPQGSIEKLTGKKLTWDDEPIMIEF